MTDLIFYPLVLAFALLSVFWFLRSIAEQETLNPGSCRRCRETCAYRDDENLCVRCFNTLRHAGLE